MEKRKSNFDLLRIFTMYGIILFHHFSNKTPAAFVELPPEFKSEYYFYDLINNIPGAVSKLSLVMDFCYGHLGHPGNLIFMTITGYFLFGKKVSFPKRVRIVANILYALLFHGIVLAVINFYLMKNCYPFSADESFLPIFNLPNWFSGDNLWYLQMYGIFILVVLPILKLFEDKLTQKVHLCLILALFFPNFLGFILHLPGIWLFNKIEHIIMCYYLGGYVSKYKVRISMRKLLAAFAAYLLFYFVFDYIWRYSCAVTYQPLQYSFTDVMQPTICVVTYSFLVFMIAVNIAGPSGFMSKALESLSSSTIGIYIFHSEFLSISFILAETFWWKDWSQKGYFLFILINSFFLLLAGHLIDIFRRLSYKKIEAALVDLFSRVE